MIQIKLSSNLLIFSKLNKLSLHQWFSTFSRAKSSKVFNSVDEALEGIGSNITLLSGGFGICGLPETLIDGLLRKNDAQNITAVSNNAGIDGRGLSKLLESGQITKMVSSYIGNNKTFERMYLEGKIELELIPQGNLAERCRAGAAGIPAYYSSAGVSTWLEEGKLPVKYAPDGTVLKYSEKKEKRTFGDRRFLLEEAIRGDVSFIKAYKVDTLGNCWFKGSANNFNSVFGKASNMTIVEAEKIVEPGEIEPENVHLAGIYVSRIIQSTAPKDIEIVKTKQRNPTDGQDSSKSTTIIKRERIIKRAAKELKDGNFVNLGIGMPTLAPSFLPPGIEVNLQSENGLLGLGDYPEEHELDPDLINAGKETVTLNSGASLFGSEESFAMIRSGRINLTILGGLQVAENGDLANWGLPGKIKGMGGAMDLVSNPLSTKVVVVMEHVDKKNRPKILKKCTFPLTGSQCVSRIITDMGVFDVSDHGLILIEIAENVKIEKLKEITEASFSVSPDLKIME